MQADGGDGVGALDAAPVWVLCSSERKAKEVEEEMEGMTSRPRLAAMVGGSLGFSLHAVRWSWAGLLVGLYA
jgi:hypothetical protein